MSDYDAVVVGAGPNGLAAAIVLARAGRSVLVLEGAETIGGGVRSAELTLPGFAHDVCSAIHPLGRGVAVLPHAAARRSTGSSGSSRRPRSRIRSTTAPPSCSSARSTRPRDGLGRDARALRRVCSGRSSRDCEPLLERRCSGRSACPAPSARARALRRCSALRSADGLARRALSTAGGRGRCSPGCAAHSMLPLDDARRARRSGSCSALLGHAVRLAAAARRLAGASPTRSPRYLRSLGGEIETGAPVESLARARRARASCCSTSRRASSLAHRRRRVCRRATGSGSSATATGPASSSSTGRSTARSRGRRPSARAPATVHLGGTLEEIAAVRARAGRRRARASGRSCCSRSRACSTPRARPTGKHTAWAYCHVPNGSTADMTERDRGAGRALRAGVPRADPRAQRIGPAELERRNANLVGGDIDGGSNDASRSSWLARCSAPFPYTTPATRRLSLLGLDAARWRRARDVRLPRRARGATSRVRARPPERRPARARAVASARAARPRRARAAPRAGTST